MIPDTSGFPLRSDKTADWVIALGPEGGTGGGKVVAMDTPEEVAAVEESWTGRYLRREVFPPFRPSCDRISAGSERCVIRH